MSRLISIRVTDDLLGAIDSYVKKTPGVNRSSFVRDASLNYLDQESEDVSYVKISADNIRMLKLVASHLNMDHDKLINMILSSTFENMQGPDPFSAMDEEVADEGHP